MAEDGRLLRRVVLRNYKSIAACDVSPAQLTFLVGPNGSGKSNFLDALKFVADSLQFSIDHALLDRGGIKEVRRRSSGRPTHFGIRLEFELAEYIGHFAFNVGAKKGGGHAIQQEECSIVPKNQGRRHFYSVSSGSVIESSLTPAPAATADRLYLVNASGVSAFRPVYDALSGMGFYSLSPSAIRDLQPPDPRELLSHNGSNIASVLGRLAARSPGVRRRIEEYLGKVVPGITQVDRKAVGPRETLQFRQRVGSAEHPWRFFASSMSDGTLRTCGVLVSLFQGVGQDRPERSLVGIEEPEVALHPAAAGVLVDSLRDAAQHVQILVTSHSADLLDSNRISDESILAVMAEQGETRVGPVDEVGRSVLRDRLYTAGELLRMNQLDPDPVLSQLQLDQTDLFD
ncbi:MAG: AAA family ATPase [Gemmatimonadetes bacterium]|nr:AAA family ATPase [Gemmatimonadota bacterium]MYH54298.1 AAA family ATPase [Gemmatimonadota bacterium]MYK67360.1 AAA family ATPase [Gemmatimonadota bacterium]